MLKLGNKALGMPQNLLAGHPYERWIIEDIKGSIEGVADEIKVIESPVIFWELKYSAIKSSNGEVEHTVMPYSPSVRVSGKPVRDVSECRSEDILIAEDASKLNNLLVLAWERGCTAVVVRGSEKRVSVSPPLLNLLPSPPPVPLIYVNNLSPLLLGTLEIDIETKSRESTGLTLQATKNGREEKVLLCSNHDTWLSQDDTKLKSHELFKKILSNRFQLDYISFSGIETGTPGLSSLYWGHGARLFLERNTDYRLAIEIGSGDSVVVPPGMETPTLEKVRKGLDPFSIGFEFVRRGIPSLYFGVRGKGEGESSYTTLNKLVKYELFPREGPAWKISRLIEDYFDALSTLPVEIKSYLTNLEGLPEGSNTLNLLKTLGRIVGLPNGSIEYYPFHKLQAIRKARGNERVFAEGRPPLTIFGGEASRLKESYLTALENEITKDYLYEFYNDLKEFL